LDLSAGLIGCRFAHFAAAMLLFGSCAFIALIAPPDLREKLARRLRRLTQAAIALAFITALLWFLLEVGMASDGGAALDPRAIADLLGTRFGEVWIVRLALGVALVGLAMAGRDADSRLMLVVCGLFLATLALVGHASMRSGALGVAQQINQALHLICAALWLGGLIPLLLILRDLRKAPDPNALIALRRYSLVGHFAVPIVIVTGIVNTRLVLRAWPLDPASPYQLLLAIKIALVAFMALLALYNRYRVAPLPGGAPDDSALSRLSANVVIELALGGFVLALVSAFATFDPA
jgi:copper resistance protein D